MLPCARRIPEGTTRRVASEIGKSFEGKLTRMGRVAFDADRDRSWHNCVKVELRAKELACTPGRVVGPNIKMSGYERNPGRYASTSRDKKGNGRK